MFEFSQLRCFVAVAEELHFGRAAARLNMTQPPLSRQIQLLEHALEARLLERSSRVVRLTPAGRAFLPEARRILRLSESAASWTRRVWRGEAGTLRLGFTAASGYSRMPALLDLLRRQLPGIDVVLREMVTHAQLEGLDSGTLDVGLLRALPPGARHASLPLAPEAMMVALQRDDPLCLREVLAPANLVDRDLIGYSPDASKYFFELTSGILDRAGVRPNVVQQVGQIHTMLALVAAGFGAALVPESAACLGMEGVAFRKLVADPAEPVELMMVWLPGNENPALAAFIEAYRNASGPAAGWTAPLRQASAASSLSDER
ncbi:LysR substrate-binding domain-containing protein [Antarcticirhabdus aurantiaca]|uniref:LysR substrate-binding domain-containing protein n=1 Tax=Antarcticirhabdus aurantiaca TaxID=2606717 RepID=A0ACD4NH62_9HYPH|nr:LysR substrate-binding domain-containing protein [Antarcticirhabdus aurantiaca]WAJ26144.1 LysR substrate-binding domain-containing protein [Jeongeuplla avenae]